MSCTAPQSGLPAPPPGHGDSAAKLEEIVGRAEFAPPVETWFDRLVEDFADWRDEMLRELFGWLGMNAGLAEGLGPWIGWGLAALLCIAMIVLVVRYLPALAEGGAPSVHAPDSVSLDADAPGHDPLALAEAHARGGRFREALEALYVGTLHSLDRRGVLRFVERKTAGAYARELAPDARRHWRVLCNELEPVAYGDRPATDEGWRSAREAARALGVGA